MIVVTTIMMMMMMMTTMMMYAIQCIQIEPMGSSEGFEGQLNHY